MTQARVVVVLSMTVGSLGLAVAEVDSNAGHESSFDFRIQLQRVPPRTIDGSLAALHLKPGFRMFPVASEPLVVDPVAITFDADGAMYAVEMRGYSEDGDQHLGRIRKLMDLDDDGRFESSWVFADGLSWPTAVTCYDGGILIAVAPELIYLKDTDGDQRADRREVWFDGFGRTNVQGLVNSLQWGLDNRIHGATSTAAAQLRSLSDPSATIELRGRDFAIEPRTRTAVATTGGGQHGMTFNRWGQRFVCQNSDHIQQLIIEDRYVTLNPFANPPASRIGIAADGPQADVFRTSPVEAWRIIRTNLRVSGQVPGPIERGGKAAGYFTGATGLRMYQGDRLPAAFLDYAFVCDVGSNLIHRKKLVDQGTRYRAERIDVASEFVTSDDIWFRPVQLANGPEGVLYVVDMCREVVEHPASLPPAIKQHLDLTSGRNRGRIWVIVADDFRHRRQPRLRTRSSSELVELLGHPNGWHRQTAARILYERHDRSVADQLRVFLRRTRAAESRLCALYALASLDELTEDSILSSLQDPHPHVRRHAIRLAEPLLAQCTRIVAQLGNLVDDTSPLVRFQLALSMGLLPQGDVRRDAILSSIAKQNIDDALILSAVQNGFGAGAAKLLAELADDESVGQHPAGVLLLQNLAAQVGRQDLDSEVEVTHDLVKKLVTARPELAMAILPNLLSRPNTQLAAALRSSDVQPLVSGLIQTARQIAVDSNYSAAQRANAIQLMSIDSTEMALSVYTQLLSASQPLAVQRAAIESIRLQSNPLIATALLGQWSTYTPTQCQTILELLMSRPVWQQAIVSALRQGTVALSDLSARQQQRLAKQTDRATWRRIESNAGISSQPPDFQQTLTRYREALKERADVNAGREVFRKVCASCHRVESFGYDLGPSLAAMKNRGTETILLNVLAPNREVNPQYLAYNVLLNDGRVIDGMIQAETATSIQIVQADNRVQTLLRVEIDELVNSGQSMMPTGLQKIVAPAQMRDLIAYLLSVDE